MYTTVSGAYSAFRSRGSIFSRTSHTEGDSAAARLNTSL